MARQVDVYPECNVDTNLMGYITGCNVNHKNCCNKVMQVLNNTDKFVIGVIDEDKKQPHIDAGFQKYECELPYEKTHISFYPHVDGKRFLFKVNKAMDQFVWDAARAMGADLKNIGYPATEKEFRKITKLEDASENPKLRQLFTQIKDYPELVAFRNTIKYLLSKSYQADVNVAKSFFDGSLTSADLNNYLNQ